MSPTFTIVLTIKARIEAAHQEHLEGEGEAIDDVIQELNNEF